MYVFAQLIDDVSGTTLAAADSRGAKGARGMEQAKAVGASIAEKAKARNITSAVFDRGGFLYAGKVKAVAEGAREGGLTF
jgi:large subunit ribosomal protein L18